MSIGLAKTSRQRSNWYWYVSTAGVFLRVFLRISLMNVSKYGRHAGHGQRLIPLQRDGKIAGQAREVHRRRVCVHIRQHSHYLSEHWTCTGLKF
jgi:hypothetical protein